MASASSTCSRLADCHRENVVARLLSSRAVGPKRHQYNIPQLSPEWIAYLSLLGPAGGCNAQMVPGPNFFAADSEAVLLASPLSRQYADADYQRLWHHMRQQHLRRSCPPWSSPPEIRRQLMDPTWQFSTGRAGIGADVLSKHFFRLMLP